MTIGELLEARNEIAKLEELSSRFISEDELVPLIHNRKVDINDFEKELRSDYVEKFPKWLNSEDMETLCLLIANSNLFEHYCLEWLKYNKPKKSIQYLKTAKTYLDKALSEFTNELTLEQKLSLIREATSRLG